jgi:hypothetical protein
MWWQPVGWGSVYCDQLEWLRLTKYWLEAWNGVAAKVVRHLPRGEFYNVTEMNAHDHRHCYKLGSGQSFHDQERMEYRWNTAGYIFVQRLFMCSRVDGSLFTCLFKGLFLPYSYTPPTDCNEKGNFELISIKDLKNIGLFYFQNFHVRSRSEMTTQWKALWFLPVILQRLVLYGQYSRKAKRQTITAYKFGSKISWYVNAWNKYI